ncbi:hypothetical protein [Arthrobacter globiformis]|nr:hypothetical protein [Arthrobacter globiformis]
MYRKIWGIVLVVAGAFGMAVATAGPAAAGLYLGNHCEPTAR